MRQVHKCGTTVIETKKHAMIDLLNAARISLVFMKNSRALRIMKLYLTEITSAALVVHIIHVHVNSQTKAQSTNIGYCSDPVYSTGPY